MQYNKSDFITNYTNVWSNKFKSLSAHKYTTFNVNKLCGELRKGSLKGKKRVPGSTFGIQLMSSENCILLDHRHNEDVVQELEIPPT
jgi:hypothetical protein